MIDHILDVTGQEQLTWLGHSQGTTQMLMGASLLPDYFAERINLFVAMAPVARQPGNPMIDLLSESANTIRAHGLTASTSD